MHVPQALLEDLEGEVEALDNSMLEQGTDPEALEKLSHQKQAAEARISELFKEVQSM